MRISNKYIFLFVGITYYFFIYTQPLYSQSTALLFKHLSAKDGLSSRDINAIYKDKRGFMWFGTDNGINIYNGYNSTEYEYNASDSLGISSNNVIDIIEDSFGKFWIGYFANGIDIFDSESETFRQKSHNSDNKNSLSNDNIRCLFEDSKKNVWIGTAGGGLNLYNRESDSFIHFQDDTLDDTDIGSNYISSIKEDKNGFLWLGTTEGILVKFNSQTKKGKSYKLYSNPTDLMLNVYGKIYIDSKNDIWYGTEKGLFLYNQEEDSFQHFVEGNTNKNLSSNAVTSVMEYQDGQYLIATYFEGLNIFDKKTGTFTYHKKSKLIETSLSSNRLVTIYKSTDGIFWIGSFTGGVNILDLSANKFHQYKDLVDPSEYLDAQKNVVAFCEDKDRNIWIGTDGEGIDIFNPETYEINHINSDENNSNTISDNVITELYKDKDNNIWIGYYTKGMSCFDWNTKQYIHFINNPNNPKSLIGNAVWSFAEDKTGDLWIGVLGSGLDKLNKSSNIFDHYKHDPDNPGSLINNFVSKVYRDNKDQIWVGTLVNGINRLNITGNSFINYETGNTTGFLGNYVLDIYQDKSGKMWVGTEKALNLYDSYNDKFDHFSEEPGQEGPFVLAITEDDHNNLWFTTNKGISTYNIIDKKFRSYNAADGLENMEFFNKTVFKSTDGKIYFGGMNGFVVFHPDSIKENSLIPPVYITRLYVSKSLIKPHQDNGILTKNISYEKSIILTYKQSSEISFEFAALNYTNSEKNQYAYWLVGFDDDWKYIANKNDVTYTNLDPGKYLFKVKASNNDGIWNEKGTSLEIIILPPWWETWLFRISLILLLIATLIGIYYIRIEQLNKQKKILEEKVFERTEELNEANTSLEEKHEELLMQNDLLSEMSEKILQQNKELEKHYNRLEEIVKERTKDLEEAKTKAEESDKLKSAFLANMSHEIRTPMNAIVGFSSLLKEEGLSTNEKIEFIEIINTNTEDLLVLINDILDLSLIEANQLNIYNDIVNINELLDNIYSYFSVFNKNDNIELKLNNELIDQHIKIQSDKTRLKQIITNLLNNALKFTEIGSIELGLKKQENSILIYVEDTGIGINNDEIKTIFKRFGKSEINKNKLYRGTGLGLSISKGLALMLGGDLTIKSELGKGSTFALVLPDSVVNNVDEKKAEIKNNTVNAIHHEENINILVVEDEEANYKYIEKLLGKINIKTEWAKNGQEAVNLVLSDRKFRIVLMDIKMPEMDGFEATQIIKSKKPEQVIIALTAYARPEDHKKFITAGFEEYITKPIKPDDFFSLLQKYLQINM